MTARLTRLLDPLASRKAACEWLMPESSMAMPTPLPSRPVLPPDLATRGPLSVPVMMPVIDSSRLAVRTVGRLGEMLVTSARAAMVLTLAAGSSADSAVTDA